jgi:virginiamycin B lyase
MHSIPHTGQATGGTKGMAYGFGSVWTGLGSTDRVFRQDVSKVPADISQIRHSPGLGAETTIRVGRRPVSIVMGEGSIWVANQGDGTISRISPTTNRVVARIQVGGAPIGLAVDSKGVWVAIGPS